MSAQTNPKRYTELDSVQKARVDSFIYTQIPFDALKAKNDLHNDTIRIVSLKCSSIMETPLNNNDEIEQIEQRFGFIHHTEYYKLPYSHLLNKEEEYNKIVYSYLDSIFQFDTQKEIQHERVRLFRKRVIIPNRSHNKLRKHIKNQINGEEKQIIKKVFDVDCLYRNRQFEEAIIGYNEIINLSIQEATRNYLVTSIYYCYLNLGQYKTAHKYRLLNVNRIKLLAK